MPDITLLKLKKVKYTTSEDLKKLIRYHNEMLTKVRDDLDSPETLAMLNAISYNLMHLSRRLEGSKKKKAKLYSFPGAKL